MKAGLNTVTIRTGLRNPAFQYSWWRWENFQIRNVHLTASKPARESIAAAWNRLPEPSGWAEINRIRLFPFDDDRHIWATGNRPGQIWRAFERATGEVSPLINLSGRYTHTIFSDALQTTDSVLAATADGLLNLPSGASDWQSIGTAPVGHAFVVYSAKGSYWAGFEQDASGAPTAPSGPGEHRTSRSRVRSTFSLTAQATFTQRPNDGVFQYQDRQWLRLPPMTGHIMIAATPAGVYRSTDLGESWQSISPPWIVWNMAFGPRGRLLVARGDGIAWTDSIESEQVTWHGTEGMENVTFFTVNPHPSDRSLIWAESWGNDIGISADGAKTMASLHNGLETLSILDVLWHAEPDQATIATIEGLFRTDDGGLTWFKLPGALRQQTIYTLFQGRDGAIWAGATDGLWVSRDYGLS